MSTVEKTKKNKMQTRKSISKEKGNKNIIKKVERNGERGSEGAHVGVGGLEEGVCVKEGEEGMTRKSYQGKMK